MTYEVGQTVYVKYHGSSGLHERKIHKVGRKWAYSGLRERFYINTGVIDGGDSMSPGSVYKSISEYEDCVRRANLRRAVRSALDRYSMYRLSDEQVSAIAKIIGVEV